MGRFVDIGGDLINVDKVVRADSPEIFGKHEKGRIDFEDGTCMYGSWYDISEIGGGGHVIQVIPCAEPVTAIYNCSGEIWEEDIYYLGLCANGEIKPITLQEGYYEVADFDNLKGLYPKAGKLKRVEGERLKEICKYFRIKTKGENQ